MSFRPLGARVFVKPDDAPDRIGRIIVPDSVKKKPNYGIVRFLGPGMLMSSGQRWPMPRMRDADGNARDVRVGDKVVYHDENYPRVRIAGEELLSMRDDHLLAVLEG